MFEDPGVYETLEAKPDSVPEIAIAMRNAVRDPGDFVPRRRWPSAQHSSLYDLEPVADWQARACAIAAAQLKLPKGRGAAGLWRPIDSAGNVAPAPAPDDSDDPDEGETGPEEMQG